MKKVTLWFKEVNEDYKYNHIENGWVEGSYPLPKSDKFSNQKAWSKEKWIYKFGNMDDNFKVEVL